ncbi:hypothetical protein ACVWYH_001754 [Bradyrhizobium sp. GM24.11]
MLSFEIEADTQIGFATGNGELDLRSGIEQRQVELDPRIGGAKLLHVAGNEIRGEAAYHRDRDLAPPPAQQDMDATISVAHADLADAF